jgi:[protein-PII] uridylyltransferase
MADLARFDSDTTLFDSAAFDRELTGGAPSLPLFKNALKQGDSVLRDRFQQGISSAELVPARAFLVDQLVVRAWQHIVGESEAALVAVGGYGRGELHPGSDVDVMILLPDDREPAQAARLERFVSFLWDIGLEVGHSVRSIDDCVRQSEADITVATNLMESRLLAGSLELYTRMRSATGPHHVWPSRSFFEAKWQEQQARHLKYHDTAYNLEPNIKEGPGGLRDIHMVGWVAKRHFGADTLHDLVAHEFLTEAEYQELVEGQTFLWDVRFALHNLAGRREDRLLFDYQTTLAKQFGHRDQDHNLAVEQFMQRYYRTVMELSRLNEMLLQHFQEAILYADNDEAPVLINKRFQARKGFIEVTHKNVFKRYPFALLEVFLLMQQHPELKGVRASTIRLIRQYRHLIDDKFRADIRARSLFMEIMRQPQGITHELRRMHRYGVLGLYLTAFGHISGRMQYDLFHTYTVDSHTLFVVRNLRRFALARHAHEFPLCSTIMSRLPKPELLYIAAIFHDIAKGRGGDHSVVGAEDAEAFCREHGLSPYDTRLVTWLVRNHLLMSMTAQRKDISDPDVINRFAQQVGDLIHLDYLYLLTVADIRATNPSLWNSWRDSLLAELYTVAKRALRRGLGNPFEKDELIHETQELARRRLSAKNVHHMTVRKIWRRFTDDYFLRYSADEIGWHTEAIAQSRAADLPLVLVNPRSSRGGTDVFVYAEDRDNTFAITVSTLDQLGLDIHDARITGTEDGYTLDSYMVLDENGEPVTDAYRMREIMESLRAALAETQLPPPPKCTLPRRLRHFSTVTQINFSLDERNNRTALELITGDRPGLLAHVGYAFGQCGVRLKNAKIATIGERAEDVFFITDADNNPLTDPARREELRHALQDVLNEPRRAQAG